MSNINEACEELESFLNDWYPQETKRVKREKRSLDQFYLYLKKQEFIRTQSRK